MPTVRDTTQVLRRLAAGDKDAAAKLYPIIYDELHALAARYMQQERADHTLQPTALVHEAYIRLVDQTRADWQNKAHFMAVSAQVIRRVLVDHAREKAARKRGGDRERVPIEAALEALETVYDVDLVALDEALAELARMSKRQARVVELRFFASLSVEQAAFVLGVSDRTVKEDWRVAKAWLRQRLKH